MYTQITKFDMENHVETIWQTSWQKGVDTVWVSNTIWLPFSIEIYV